MRNEHLPEPIAQVVNSQTKHVRPWNPLKLCAICEHMTLVSYGAEPRCAEGPQEHIRPPAFLQLCEAKRAPGGACANGEHFSPRR